MTQPAFPNIAPFRPRELVDETHLNAIRAALRYLKGTAVGTDPGVVLESALGFVNLTAAQRDALTLRPGLTIYNTTTNRVETYNGTSWQATAGGALSDITAVLVDRDLVGGGTQGDVTVGAGPTLTRRAQFSSGRIYYLARSSYAALSNGHFAITTSELADVEPDGWGASNLVLSLAPLVPSEPGPNPRHAVAWALAPVLTPGNAIRLSYDESNYVVMTIAAPPVLSGGLVQIQMNSSVVTGTLVGISDFQMDINTGSPVPIAAELIRNPGELVAGGGTNKMQPVVLDGSQLRASPAGSMGGGGSLDDATKIGWGDTGSIPFNWGVNTSNIVPLDPVVAADGFGPLWLEAPRALDSLKISAGEFEFLHVMDESNLADGRKLYRSRENQSYALAGETVVLAYSSA